ncbi:reverse transcriptase domain-containing protein [Tanacetum coccineum]
MERFESAIFKQCEEINGRMTEMFGLLKELTTSRDPEKVLVREEAKSLVTKSVNSISLIKEEKEKNNMYDVAPGDDSKETDRPDMEVSVKEVETKNGAESGAKNKPIKNPEKEKVVETPSSRHVEYYLKHRINEKLIEGLVDNNRFNDSLLGARAGKKKGKTHDMHAETEIRLSLASHSYIYPLGIAKDVLVEIAEHVYPMDFVILDIKEDEKSLFILGTPFLTTAKAMIKFDKGTITLSVRNHCRSDHFEIKTNLLQLVQANPFYGRENDNPHAHINSFKRITSTLRFRNVPNDVIKLMMFPYSLEGAAKTWYEKEPPNSILTWEDLVTKFVNQFFPPSKTTHLKNEISRFTQKFEETFSEAWERFKELLRACPHHGFTELTQVDTFYNGLNDNEQDSLNAAAGGNLLSKTTREALNIIENKSKVRYSRNKPNASRMNVTSSKTDERIDKLADQLSTLVEIVSKKVVTPAPVKAVEESCVTCGGAHAWYNCPATDNNQASVCATTGTYNQVNPPNRVSNQMAPPGFAPVQNNGQNRFNQNHVQGNNFNRGNNFQGNQGFQSQVNHAPNFQNQGFQNQPFQVPHNQVQDFSNEFSSYKKSNDQTIRNLQYQITSMKGELKNEIQNTIKSQQNALMSQNNAFQNTLQNNLQNMLSGFFQAQASPSGTLPSNTVPNPKGEMKAITTRSGVAYEGPSIPTNPSPKKVVERETEETTDKEQTNFQGSTAQIPPPVIPISIPEPDVPTTLPKTTPIPESDIPKSLPKPNIPYPSRRDDQKSRFILFNQPPNSSNL